MQSIEPYELAVAALSEKFSPIYDGYRERVIPLAGVEGFRTAPARLSVDSRLEEINQLAELGKLAKARNQWDEEWEAGVSALIDAYNKFADLHGEIEEWVFREKQHSFQIEATRTATHHTGLHVKGIWIGIVGALIALAGIGVGYLLAVHPPAPIPAPPPPSVIAPK